MSEDRVLHALAWDDNVRIVAAQMTQTVRAAAQLHGTALTSSAALGRVLMAARLMQATVKDTERVTIQFKGFGMTGLLLGRAEPDGDVYGSIQNPDADPPLRPDGRLDVGAAVGWAGEMMVVRDTSATSEPYVGVTEIVSGEIAEDLANYLVTSEQINSAVALGVMMGNEGEVLGAGGLVVQILGGLDDGVLETLEARIRELGNLSQRITEGTTAEDLIRMVAGDDARILSERPVRYHCDRGRDYYAARLRGLDVRSLVELFAEDDSIELRCEFTQQTHVFLRSEFLELLN